MLSRREPELISGLGLVDMDRIVGELATHVLASLSLIRVPGQQTVTKTAPEVIDVYRGIE